MEVEDEDGGGGGIWRRRSMEEEVMLDEGQKMHGNKHNITGHIYQYSITLYLSMKFPCMITWEEFWK